MALILIVDDALLSRSMVRKILTGLGHTTIEAKDGKQALSMIQEHKPDCVCLDMLLPELNGIQVLEKLREENNSIPVIMITADTQETTRQKCLDLGAITVFNKPVKADQLIPILNQIFN
jgi:CheY-like chemotaxis protein